jgi:hypothetical protein
MSKVDYDPQKAHEYYMKHRKLKGRRSTKGFSQTKKEQWAYVKKQLSEEHKGINKDISESRNERIAAISEALKKQKEALTIQAKAKIEALRDRMKYMSPAEKRNIRDSINSIIGDIRAEVKSKKESLQETGAKTKENERNKAKNAKAKESKAYEKRLDDAYKNLKG